MRDERISSRAFLENGWLQIIFLILICPFVAPILVAMKIRKEKDPHEEYLRAYTEY